MPSGLVGTIVNGAGVGDRASRRNYCDKKWATDQSNTLCICVKTLGQPAPKGLDWIGFMFGDETLQPRGLRTLAGLRRSKQ